ncbi:MAG: sigma-70 family RNA polymerase sigma factor [Ignavibacteriaceae bacterium]|jgi:RNA polymerase sigma-70 factor (ECF subfamily)|nr:sigma-70 family RNA polymerase sigma factor [Ignavibacterium sp.]MCC6256308.1 sigma-70 family RNA polymerase sigma factor [Ignavibacteriaceae bacterium]HRN27008.1 sigma-70 family RNA polymerase sigma factor [Ignavibacteriaceae bacterium]HRP93131.1 sigma-70 family RNA polymerase sigma factor [Ignavibacteriaceae bacterium]HRQ53266.1 sigma-70 family RNA polymerase sigma factor [Ignavibacteriaceae bacterium]
MEESKLVELAKSGDRQALAQLVKNNEQTVYNFSFKICRDRDKAEHIMQETFYSMIKSLHQFDGNSKLSTWLYRIVSNHCLMLARKDKSRTFVSIDNDDDLYEDKYTADWSNIPNQNIENTELKKILDESIDKLSPEYRIVFLLRDVEGLSTEETADMTELSVPAVKSRLHRARAFLRKELNEAFSR